MNLWLLVCGLIGHSPFVTTFFGYGYCARCGGQIGDNLAGAGFNAISISKRHRKNCAKCNAIRWDWKGLERIFYPLEEKFLRWRENRE